MSDYLNPDKKKDTCVILHDVVTLLTTLLVSEIKMAAQILRSKVSCTCQPFYIYRRDIFYLKSAKIFHRGLIISEDVQRRSGDVTKSSV